MHAYLIPLKGKQAPANSKGTCMKSRESINANFRSAARGLFWSGGCFPTFIRGFRGSRGLLEILKFLVFLKGLAFFSSVHLVVLVVSVVCSWFPV